MKIRSFALAVVILVPCLALAEVDLSGNWVAESSEDPLEHSVGSLPDDFAGIPTNEAGRQLGTTWPAEVGQELNRMCQPYPVHYLMVAPWGGRFSATRDQFGHITAWTLSSPAYDRFPMTIWMDGRAMPPLTRSLHMYSGYSIGRWEGETLVVSTALLKDSFLLDNGFPSSNEETDSYFFTRYGDEMTLTGIIRDPVYLEAPLVMSRTLKLQSGGGALDNPILYCLPTENVAGLSDGYHSAFVPPPEEARQKEYMKMHYSLPLDATLGGAKTMYPEFQKELRMEYKPLPGKCSQYSQYCMQGIRGAATPDILTR